MANAATCALVFHWGPSDFDGLTPAELDSWAGLAKEATRGG